MSLQNEAYRPNHTSFAIEGLMKPHFFPLSKTSTQFLCEPVCSFARLKDPFTEEKEEFISVGLIGSEDGKRHRNDLNLVVVLDISGSMDSPFNELSKNKSSESISNNYSVKRSSKLDIAKKCLEKIYKNLKEHERFGLVLFDSHAYISQPLRTVKDIDSASLLKKISEISTKGSTNLYAGMQAGIEMLTEQISDDESLGTKKPENIPTNNRLLFLTGLQCFFCQRISEHDINLFFFEIDGLPNTGGEFEDMHALTLKAASKKTSIFTTFIGLGIDFGSDLVSRLTKIRGANYFTVDAEESFQKLLLEDFNYMVFYFFSKFFIKFSQKNSFFLSEKGHSNRIQCECVF